MALYWKCAKCNSRNPEETKICKKCNSRITKNCRWGVDITINYQRIKKTIGTKEAAIAYEAKIKEKLLKKKIASELGLETDKIDMDDIPTFETFWIRYYIWCKSINQKVEWKLRKWKNHLKHFFAYKKLNEIKARDIVNYQTKRIREGAKPATINREAAIIRHMLNLAVKWDIIPHNPIARKIEMLPEEEKRQYLTPEEVIKIYHNIEDTYKDLFLFLVSTGLRIGEALNLTWENINLDEKVIIVKGYQTKTKKEFAIPLNSLAFEILKKKKMNKNSPNSKIFPHSKKWFHVAFKKALEKAGINKNIRIHDLRHTYASWLVQSGAPIQMVQLLLAHKQIETTLRYAHLAVKPLAPVTEKIAEILKVNTTIVENLSNQG